MKDVEAVALGRARDSRFRVDRITWVTVETRQLDPEVAVPYLPFSPLTVKVVCTTLSP